MFAWSIFSGMKTVQRESHKTLFYAKRVTVNVYVQNTEQKEPLQKAQNNKIANVAGSVWSNFAVLL